MLKNIANRKETYLYKMNYVDLLITSTSLSYEDYDSIILTMLNNHHMYTLSKIHTIFSGHISHTTSKLYRDINFRAPPRNFFCYHSAVSGSQQSWHAIYDMSCSCSKAPHYYSEVTVVGFYF